MPTYSVMHMDHALVPDNKAAIFHFSHSDRQHSDCPGVLGIIGDYTHMFQTLIDSYKQCKAVNWQ